MCIEQPFFVANHAFHFVPGVAGSGMVECGLYRMYCIASAFARRSIGDRLAPRESSRSIRLTSIRRRLLVEGGRSYRFISLTFLFVPSIAPCYGL